MKLLLTAILSLTMCGTSLANGMHRHGYHNHYGWVAPVVIGSVAAYALTRPVVVEQPPQVVVVPPNRTGFYCSTSGYFYPQVQTCNVPWQPVNY